MLKEEMIQEKYKVSYLPAFIGISAIAFFIAFAICFSIYLQRDRVEQELRAADRNFDTRIATYVWYEGEIVFSRYDHIDSIIKYPYLKKVRYDEAKKVLNILKGRNTKTP